MPKKGEIGLFREKKKPGRNFPGPCGLPGNAADRKKRFNRKFKEYFAVSLENARVL